MDDAKEKAARIRAIYSSMDSIERNLGGGEGIEGLYGSIGGTGMQRILDSMRQHCGLNTDSHLLDVGAGLGRPLLHALVTEGIAGASGIELDRVKCMKAEAFMPQTFAALARKGTLSADDLPPVPHIANMPVENAKTLDPATHAYSFWEGVPIDARVRFGQLFAASKTLQCVAVVQRCMVHFSETCTPSDVMEHSFGFCPLELVDTFSVSMSGSGRSFKAYIFRRADGKPRLVGGGRVAATTATAQRRSSENAAIETPEREDEVVAALQDLSVGGDANDDEEEEVAVLPKRRGRRPSHKITNARIHQQQQAAATPSAIFHETRKRTRTAAAIEDEQREPSSRRLRPRTVVVAAVASSPPSPQQKTVTPAKRVRNGVAFTEFKLGCSKCRYAANGCIRCRQWAAKADAEADADVATETVIGAASKLSTIQKLSAAAAAAQKKRAALPAAAAAVDVEDGYNAVTEQPQQQHLDRRTHITTTSAATYRAPNAPFVPPRLAAAVAVTAKTAVTAAARSPAKQRPLRLPAKTTVMKNTTGPTRKTPASTQSKSKKQATPRRPHVQKFIPSIAPSRRASAPVAGASKYRTSGRVGLVEVEVEVDQSAPSTAPAAGTVKISNSNGVFPATRATTTTTRSPRGLTSLLQDAKGFVTTAVDEVTSWLAGSPHRATRGVARQLKV